MTLPRVHPTILILALGQFLLSFANSFVIISLTRTVDQVARVIVHLPENTMLGLVISMFGFALAGGQPIFGMVADRRRCYRSVLLAGMMGFTVATLGLAHATLYWQVLGLRALQGLALAATFPTTLAIIAHVSPARQRGQAMAVFTSAQLLGFGIGPLVGGALLLHVSAAVGYRWLTLVTLLGVAWLAWRLPRDGEAPALPPPDGEPEPEEAPATAGGSLLPFALLAALMFVCACCVSMIIALEQSFTDRLQLSSFEFSLAFSTLILARLLLDLPMGALSDRLGRKRLILLGLALLGPCTLGMAFAPTLAMLIATRIGMGLAMSLISTPAFALVGDLQHGARSSTRMAIVTSGFGLGLAIGPLLTAVLADGLGFAAPFWLYAGFTLILVTILAVRIEEPERAPRPILEGAQ